ncbi:MAG: aminopeptidase P family protein [Synergistaceae bacterium]|jgi:Xaa-Pro aminopeptidase|nr:aminopeptidase P family protein [Synergistaceae bacterium]
MEGLVNMRFDIVRGRLEKLRQRMREQQIDALTVMVFERLNSENCHYISGFRGSSAALVIDAKRELLITDGRYRTQAALQSPFTLVVQSDLPLAEYVVQVLSKSGYKTAGFEAEKVSCAIFETVLKKAPVEWKDASALIPSLRRSKDAEEVAAIRRAGVIARQAFDRVLKDVRVGMTEVDFESRLISEIKRAGAEKGWAHDDFIVVSGARGAMCHGRATDRAFERGDTVTLDYGAMIDGYMCDITRNFAVGGAQDRAVELDGILVKAHREAAAALRPGVSGKEVDAVARRIIEEAGYGNGFVHGLGHGLGLEIHESPRLSFLSKDILQAGDVVTIEPGIYIEGWGGLRVEDDYLITENGAECLTQSDDQHLKIAG